MVWIGASDTAFALQLHLQQCSKRKSIEHKGAHILLVLRHTVPFIVCDNWFLLSFFGHHCEPNKHLGWFSAFVTAAAACWQIVWWKKK